MNPHIPGQAKTRKPVMIFIKSFGAPIVLYVDEPEEVYEEVKKIIAKANTHSPKMIEKIGKGPLKKVAVFDTEIVGVALQEEPAV